jgi:glutathione S-transferase
MLTSIQAAGLMTIIAVVFTFIAGARVGALRGARKIEAPATVGDPDFERAFRVHMNTIESLVVFLPLLWLGALAFDGMIALYIGLIWIVGRLIYMNAYMSDPAKRAPGAIITMVPLVGLLIISVWGLFF